MFGYGRGLHRGRFWPYTLVSAPEGYTYLGPCRCGFGPDAFYRDKSGRIVHASQLLHGSVPQMVSTEDPEVEISQLRVEKAELERRIKELEEHLKGKERKS
jgi:hypothetical protein